MKSRPNIIDVVNKKSENESLNVTSEPASLILNCTQSDPTEFTAKVADRLHKKTSSNIHDSEVDQKRGVSEQNWRFWKGHEGVPLWVAVALSRNINPSKISNGKITEINQPIRYRRYKGRLKKAVTWLNIILPIQENNPKNGILPEDKVVRLSDFVRCAKDKGLKMPPQMFAIINDSKLQIDDRKESSVRQFGIERLDFEQKKWHLQEIANKIAKELAEKGRLRKITKELVVKEFLDNKKWTENQDVTEDTFRSCVRVKW